MSHSQLIDRRSKQPCTEEVYGRWALSLLYGNGRISRSLAFFLLPLFTQVPWLSRFYGFLQRLPGSRKKIKPFVRTFQVDASEFEKPLEAFTSFDDFFVRKLKPETRPIDTREDRAILPADGRYFVLQNLQETEGFYVKGQHFDLLTFLQDPVLARRFATGSMVIVRLCPSDYHRFHFPVSGLASPAKAIQGALYSVNPIALRKRLSIFWENKRVITEIESKEFGTVLMVEVGATFVGSVHQTYRAGQQADKGEEKGYFSFGGSSLVLLFEKDRILLDEDLIAHSKAQMKTRGFMGSVLGRRPRL